ncbi:hypothetical protein [Sphingomonas sp. TWP1-3-1]|jgi:hypothetical protein|uniref:hypothetical protein n=1 Tax=Sphingomonas sp. TWP1-3-1 TaxID=2804612 RepID=UPI003CF82A04
MDPNVVKAKLIEVLQTVQALSGEECPAIDGGTRPAEALPKFTSKVWPVAAGMLGIAIGKTIPCEANIFVDDDTKVPLAINQTVALVLKILEAQDAKEDEEARAE